MTDWYVYLLTRDQFRDFARYIENLVERNDEFHVYTAPFQAWLDPETSENRRRVVLEPGPNEVFVVAKSGVADWDIVRWIALVNIRMDPPPIIYF